MPRDHRLSDEELRTGSDTLLQGHAREMATELLELRAERRASAPQIEPLPLVVGCGTAGCYSMIASDLLPSVWIMVDGVWICAGCQQRRRPC